MTVTSRKPLSDQRFFAIGAFFQHPDGAVPGFLVLTRRALALRISNASE